MLGNRYVEWAWPSSISLLCLQSPASGSFFCRGHTGPLSMLASWQYWCDSGITLLWVSVNQKRVCWVEVTARQLVGLCVPLLCFLATSLAWWEELRMDEIKARTLHWSAKLKWELVKVWDISLTWWEEVRRRWDSAHRQSCVCPLKMTHSSWKPVFSPFGNTVSFYDVITKIAGFCYTVAFKNVFLLKSKKTLMLCHCLFPLFIFFNLFWNENDS